MSVIAKITIVPPTVSIFPTSVSLGAAEKLGFVMNTDINCTELFLQARELHQEGRDDAGLIPVSLPL